MTKSDLTVLMSVWAGDSSSKFHASLVSVLDQSLKPDEVLLGVDGPVGEDLKEVISWAEEKPLRVIYFPDNRGLAWVLNDLLEMVETTFVARMDADDRSRPKRFEVQRTYLENNPSISVLGGSIVVRSDSREIYRSYPTDPKLVARACKYKNPLNHPTVMMRTRSIRDVGGYPRLTRCQDWALWGLLLRRGYVLANIDEVILEYSGGADLNRRRGWSYLKYELGVLKYFFSIGFLSRVEYGLSVSLRMVGRGMLILKSVLKPKIN